VQAVGLDDALDDLVAHDVLMTEANECDAVDPGEDVAHLDEPGRLLARQVDLRDVAGHDHPRAEPEPRQEHLHLLRRRVLGLVEDHERVVERVVSQQEVLRDVERDPRRDHEYRRFPPSQQARWPR
jgi:hypothetical protein